MALSMRARTVELAVLMIGVAQLTGTTEVLLTGWETSQLDVLVFAGALGVSLCVAARYSAPHLRGPALGIAVYAGLQVSGYVVLTPTPPTAAELVIGFGEGLGFLGAAVYLKRWRVAAETAAQLDSTAHAEPDA